MLVLICFSKSSLELSYVHVRIFMLRAVFRGRHRFLVHLVARAKSCVLRVTLFIVSRDDLFGWFNMSLLDRRLEMM